MSATAAVREFMEGYRPKPGMDAYAVAREMLFWQGEIYSSHMGSDFHPEFDNLPRNVRASWLRSARRKMREERRRT